MDNNPEVELTVACGYGDVGQRLRPNAVVRDWIIGNGYGRLVNEAESPERPARMSAKAAKALNKSMFG